jgi:hypothetical protein
MGIDWGCRYYKNNHKCFLILESKRYRSQKVISDLSGCDFEPHNEKPQELVTVVRNWFANNTGKKSLEGGSIIWDSYNLFYADLYKSDKLKKKDVDRLPVSELVNHMVKWHTKKIRRATVQ